MSSRLTAMDIEQQQFRRKVRGYDPEEVDLFLKALAEEIGRLTLDNGSLREEVGTLRGKLDEHRTLEKTLQETLISAQKMAEDTRDRARQQAELILGEARLEGDKLQRDARTRLAGLESDIERCRGERENFEQRLRSVIEQHLALLDMRRKARNDLDNLRVMPTRASHEAG